MVTLCRRAGWRSRKRLFIYVAHDCFFTWTHGSHMLKRQNDFHLDIITICYPFYSFITNYVGMCNLLHILVIRLNMHTVSNVEYQGNIIRNTNHPFTSCVEYTLGWWVFRNSSFFCYLGQISFLWPAKWTVSDILAVSWLICKNVPNLCKSWNIVMKESYWSWGRSGAECTCSSHFLQCPLLYFCRMGVTQLFDP